MKSELIKRIKQNAEIVANLTRMHVSSQHYPPILSLDGKVSVLALEPKTKFNGNPSAVDELAKIEIGSYEGRMSISKIEMGQGRNEAGTYYINGIESYKGGHFELTIKIDGHWQVQSHDCIRAIGSVSDNGELIEVKLYPKYPDN